MSIKDKHPLYTAMAEKWQLGLHSYDGEDTIKKQTTTYLKPTSGQILDGQGIANSIGQRAYEAYLSYAVYPDIYCEAVEAAIGIMHREPPKIELPTQLKDMIDNGTLLGEPLEMVLRKINTHQLITGRVGILGDIRKDTDGKARPVIAIYGPLAICNWDDTSVADDDVDIRLVVLDESRYEMGASFTWDLKESYKILALSDGQTLTEDGTYMYMELEEGSEFNVEMLTQPNIMGQSLDTIPFAFVNSKDLSPSPDKPPLEGLASLCLAIYRAEASYRLNLFMQGQDTLVTIGAGVGDDEPIRTGAGAAIRVNIGGDAKYIGVSSAGLTEQRTSLENDYKRAIQKSGQLLDATSRAKESGDALRIRVAAQTATLPQLAKTGAAGLERVLKALARWYGANENEVIVKPNLTFTEQDLNGETLIKIMEARQVGAPISLESVHNWLRDNGLTKMTLDEELDAIEQEEPDRIIDKLSPVDKQADPDEDTGTGKGVVNEND